MTETPVVYPPFLKPEHYNEYNEDYLMSKVIYKSWINKPGYTKEQGRELAKLHLVLGSTTTLIISGNYQALYEYLQLRLCSRAEWEIRGLAEGMRDRLIPAVPAIFADLGCKGDEYGFCPEAHGGCGKYLQKEVI
jgi:thymidylate synthase (FAD)